MLNHFEGNPPYMYCDVQLVVNDGHWLPMQCVIPVHYPDCTALYAQLYHKYIEGLISSGDH